MQNATSLTLIILMLGLPLATLIGYAATLDNVYYASEVFIVVVVRYLVATSLALGTLMTVIVSRRLAGMAGLPRNAWLIFGIMLNVVAASHILLTAIVAGR